MFKKIIQIAAMLILLTCAAQSGVFAQNAQQSDPIIGAFFYNGVEVSPGYQNLGVGALYGNTFVLSSTGEWETYHLTVSINHNLTSIHAGGSLPVTGGSWSLIKYSNEGQFLGTLYGNVSSGSVSFSECTKRNCTDKQIIAELVSTGCSISAFSQCNNSVSGTLTMTTRINSPQTSGTLYLDF